MIEKTLAYIKSHRSFFVYISIGFIGLFFDFGSLMLMVKIFHVPVLIANPIAMSIGIVNNFFWNAYFNFRQTGKLWARFLAFYAVGMVGIFVGDLILWIFNDVGGRFVSQILSAIWRPLGDHRLEMVKAGSIVIIGVMQYFLNKNIAFRKHND